MADNVSIKDAAGATVVIATDDVGSGIQAQRLKSVWGVDGTAVDTSASNPFPVTIISSSVGSTVDTEDGTIAGGQSNVTAVVNLPYTFDPTSGNWTRVGATTFFSYDLDETAEQIKATAGTLYGYAFANFNATLSRVLRFYNHAAPTVGTTPVLFAVMLPAAASGHVWFGAAGPAFSTALSAAATTGTGAASTGAPGADEVMLTAWYK